MLFSPPRQRIATPTAGDRAAPGPSRKPRDTRATDRLWFAKSIVHKLSSHPNCHRGVRSAVVTDVFRNSSVHNAWNLEGCLGVEPGHAALQVMAEQLECDLDVRWLTSSEVLRVGGSDFSDRWYC